MFRKARGAVLERTRGHYPAPLEALAAVEEGSRESIAEALAIENAHLGNLIGTPIQKNLMRIFFWTEEIKKETGTPDPGRLAAGGVPRRGSRRRA